MICRYPLHFELISHLFQLPDSRRSGETRTNGNGHNFGQVGHGSDGHMPHGHTYGQVGHGSDGHMSHGHHVSSPPLVRIDTGSVSSGETLNVHKRGIDEEQV